MREGQSNENRTSAKSDNGICFYSKAINTFIPLGDETINFSLVKRGRSLTDPQPHPFLHLFVRPEHEFVPLWFVVFRDQITNPRNHIRRNGSMGLSRAWIVLQWCASFAEPLLPFLVAIHSRHAAMNITCSSNLIHQETNHTSLLLFACLHL